MAGSKKKGAPDKNIQFDSLKISLTGLEDIPIYYANYFEISFSPHDFGIIAAHIPSRLSQRQINLAEEKGELPVEAILQVTISPSVMPRLIDALGRQKEKYEKSFGPIVVEQEAEESDNG